MITIIFAIFAVICLGFIAYLLNKVWKLESEIDSLQSRLAFAGKNYIEKTNELKDEIKSLKNKINAKKTKDTKILCKSSKKNSVKVIKRKR